MTAISTSQAQAMLHTMADMQEQHNVLVHPQWREQGFEFYRAMWVECAEMLDHFGWKWWKQQKTNNDIGISLNEGIINIEKINDILNSNHKVHFSS